MFSPINISLSIPAGSINRHPKINVEITNDIGSLNLSEYITYKIMKRGGKKVNASVIINSYYKKFNLNKLK